ncbi:hypothetical protein QOZ80_9AG0677260 [Eleusine coracana subsp. coracana]|nr:hypothetical protein QOZ80_9AG0677260 [Eleusine coracana subsp. coracana]
MLVYVSREKRPGYDHNKKAGAMNALVRVSAVMSNAPFILKLDCDHYVYNSQAFREGMCFMMDGSGDRIGYVQFPQRFEGIDPSDLDKNGRPPGALTIPRHILDAYTIAEAISVISCDYENKTEWGRRVGWIYGSVTEDLVTGYQMHSRGWKSVYCVTKRDAFRGTTPINLIDRLHQVLRWSSGSIEIFFSRNNALLASRRMKFLQKIAYLNLGIYPFISIFLIVYCFLPALSLFSGQFIVQELSLTSLTYLLAIILTTSTLAVLEIKWSGISLEEWWWNEQFWLIGGTSAHIIAMLQGLLKVSAGIEISFILKSMSGGNDVDDEFKLTSLIILPIVIIMVNLIAIVVGFTRTIYSEIPQWSRPLGGVFFSFWVLAHLYPCAKGLMGREGRTPTIVFLVRAPRHHDPAAVGGH